MFSVCVFVFFTLIFNIDAKHAKDLQVNKFIDDILLNVGKNGPSLGLEPLNLPNISQTSWTSKLIKEFELSNGILKNLTIVNRSGNCILEYNKNVIHLIVEVEFKNLEIYYDLGIKAYFSLLSLAGNVEGNLKNFKVKIDMNLNALTLKPKANDITFPSPGQIDLKINTSMIEGFIINSILKLATTIFESLVIHDIQITITDALNEAFKKFPPPDML